jgi:signal transduction histidine kinase
MASSLPIVNDADITMDPRVRLEDLVDRQGLTELCQSFFGLFGIPIRIFSADGAVLADASREHEVCAYVNTIASGRAACGATVGAAKVTEPGPDGVATHPCFTGQEYRIVAVTYEGRRIGRVVLGPYLPAELTELPESFADLDPAVDLDRARHSLLKSPRAKAETVARIAKHLAATLDLVLFSGHKTLLTSQMHLASVRESFRELTEKNTRLQEAYDRLKELDRLKSNFLATVSHELRTPLTSIIGYSEMLSEGIAGPLTDEQKEFVTTIQTKGEQLLSLITSLLDMSKLESGTMSVRKIPILIQDVLGEVQKTLAPVARKKGVNLKIEGNQDLPRIKGDPERLRQVFVNLGDNAIKFTPKDGTVAFRLSVTSGSDDDEEGLTLLAPTHANIEVRVTDTGIGIPDQEKAKVFDAFYQVDSSSTREYGGTGLGLAIVKRLVEAHQGKITIEDNEPQGTQFVVRIPVSSD